MSLPQKHDFEMHICGFDFDVVNMEDEFFSWGQVFNLRQGPKEQKNYGPHESWGGCMDSPSGSPTSTGKLKINFNKFIPELLPNPPFLPPFMEKINSYITDYVLETHVNPFLFHW